MMEDLRMAELLCTRLCHDLTGPIGAVNNGAEFLSEEGFNLQNQAVELIVSSAFSAVSRLQFYRFAYGRVKDHGEAALADKQKMTQDFFAGSKITVDWPDEHTDAAGVSLSLRMVRMLFNLLIISSGALLRGGTIAVRISADAQGNRIVRVEATGQSVKLDEEIEAVLSGKDDMSHPTPKNVQACLTRKLSEEIHASLHIEHSGDRLLLVASQPVIGQSAMPEVSSAHG